MQGNVLYQFFCMNSLIDRRVFNDFSTDQEAIDAAVNYEAVCVKISGTDRKVIYDPAEH